MLMEKASVPEGAAGEAVHLRLWVHEVMRVFGDRLTAGTRPYLTQLPPVCRELDVSVSTTFPYPSSPLGCLT